MKLNFRTLRADEIDVRVGAIDKSGNKWITLLLYKNARVDMDILDETVGIMNWQRSHLRNNANCVVSIYDDEKKEWVSKEDTGTESNTEKEKGQASDSFKRACVNWGIGRELYTAPKIFVSGEADKLKHGEYKVKSVTYTPTREISGLSIVDKNGKEVFKKSPLTITDSQVTKLQILLKSHPEEYKKALYKKLGIKSSKELTFSQASDLIKKLEAKSKENKDE